MFDIFKDTRATVRAAVVGGLFLLIVSVVVALVNGVFGILGDTKTIIYSAPPGPTAEVQFLGIGFAKVDGPRGMFVDSSDNVVLTVSLLENVRAEDIIVRTAPSGQPDVKASPRSSGLGRQGAELKNVPIYSRMRAKLDAIGFRYQETGWVAKEVRETASWVWNIRPAEGTGSYLLILE